MKNKLLFRADGNSNIGLGHLYRLFAISEMLKDNYSFIFLLKEDSISTIFPKEYSIEFIPNKIAIEEEPNWISQKYISSDYIMILDGYQFKSSYQKKIKELKYKLIYIDDLATEHMYADVVINHSSAFSEVNYRGESHTKYLLGADYAMLRPVFNKAATKSTRLIKEIKNVFVCFGGADPYNLTLKSVTALLSIKEIEKINIVIGGAYNNEAILDIKQEDDRLSIYKNIDENLMLELMSSSDLGIVPSSTILYEICAVKMLVLSGYYVNNQINIYNSLLSKNVIVGGGDFSKYEVETFHNLIKSIINLKQCNELLSSQKSLIDGKSKKRFLGLLNDLNLELIRATEEDLMDVFHFSNEKSTRDNSYESKLIDLESHKKWYLSKIKEKNTLFLIAKVNGISAGLVRYQIEGTKSVIGIVIGEKYRGQNLAVSLLRKSSKVYFEKYSLPIYAYIKNENKASIKSFEKANYNFFQNEIIKRCPSKVYKLEKYYE